MLQVVCSTCKNYLEWRSDFEPPLCLLERKPTNLENIDVCSDVSHEIPALHLITRDFLDQDVGWGQDQGNEDVKVILELSLNVPEFAVKIRVCSNLQSWKINQNVTRLSMKQIISKVFSTK